MGWSIDTRQLFIGNGALDEGAPQVGNTEILTEFSNVLDLTNTYTYKGLAAGYQVQTGASPLSPVTRSLQDKLDDIANFRDFGGVGDNSTNNIASLNRAIQQLYFASLITSPIVRRTLWLSAGQYIISGDFVRLLPYVRLKGDGKNNTFIIQTDATQPCVLATVDSDNHIGALIGSSSAVLPQDVEIEDITLVNNTLNDVVTFDSASKIFADRVAFQGSQSLTTNNAIDTSCIRLTSNVGSPYNIALNNCDFSGETYAIMTNVGAYDITVFNGNFNNLYQGVNVGIASNTITVYSNVTTSTGVAGGPVTWTSVSNGYEFTAGVQTNGTLWAWGRNSSGQLGTNSITNYSAPVQVGALTAWKNVSCGYAYMLAVQNTGTLWACGYNSQGQLGQGNITNYSSPVQVGALTNWNTVNCGPFHAAAIKTDGTLWAWGLNVTGELGLGNATNYSSPVQVGGLTNWASVACGYLHTAAIKTDGTLWSWGLNNDGQLGLGNIINYSSPVQVGALTNWAEISCGMFTTTAVKTDGTMWTWGAGAIHHSSPVQVGSLATWKSVVSSLDPTQLALTTTGEITIAETRVGTSANWTAISSSAKNIAAAQSNLVLPTDAITYSAIDSTGLLWLWGDNTGGQLGLNTSTTSFPLPVQLGNVTVSTPTWNSVSCGYNHILAVKTNGSLWGWGDNYFGQLGTGNTTTYSSLVQIQNATTWMNIAAGNGFTLATMANNSLWAWGDNGNGQLGSGTTTNTSLPTLVTATVVNPSATMLWNEVAAGKTMAFATTTDGKLWQIGSSIVQIGASTGWTDISGGALNDNFSGINGGIYYEWGPTLPITLSQVNAATNWVDVTPGGAGIDSTGNLYVNGFTVGPIATHTNWKQIAISNNTVGYAMGVRTDGTRWGWTLSELFGPNGNDAYGQLGVGSTTSNPGLWQNPTQLDTMTDWKSIQISDGWFTVGLKTDNTMWVWGADGYSNFNASNNVGNSSTPMQIGHLSPSEVGVAWTSVPLTTTNIVITTTTVATTTTTPIGTQPSNIKITNSIFDNIAAEAFVTDSMGTGVQHAISAFNTYKNVGNMLGNTSVTHVVNFGGNNSYSIADVFDRAYNDVIAPVNLNNTASIAVLPNGQLMLGRQVTVGGNATTLTDNSINAPAGIVGFGEYPTVVEFTISRATDKRTGIIKIVPSNGTIVYDSEYVETTDIGVELTPVLNNGMIQLNYTTTATGNSAEITTSSRSLF